MSHMDSTHGCISSSTGSCLGGLNNYGESVDQTLHLSMASPSMCLLPLYDCNKQLLPIHFLTDEETQRGETLLRDWLDVAITRRGYLMARMRSARRHPLVASLIEMWIDRYRHMDDYDYEDCGSDMLHAAVKAAPESIGACSQTAATNSSTALPTPSVVDGAHCKRSQSSASSDQSDCPHESRL